MLRGFSCGFRQHTVIRSKLVRDYFILPAVSNKLLNRVFLRVVCVFLVQCGKGFLVGAAVNSLSVWESSDWFGFLMRPFKGDSVNQYNNVDFPIVHWERVILYLENLMGAVFFGASFLDASFAFNSVSSCLATGNLFTWTRSPKWKTDLWCARFLKRRVYNSLEAKLH